MIYVVGIALFILVALVVLRGVRGPVPQPPRPRGSVILVDGSNVLHWGGDPSVLVLKRVLRAIGAKGYRPHVYFDANVGYVLDACYYDAARMATLLGLPDQQITVVDKGVCADEVILTHATRDKRRIVTNDRYRDWRGRFAHLRKKGVLIGGAWRDGTVVWRGNL